MLFGWAPKRSPWGRFCRFTLCLPHDPHGLQARVPLVPRARARRGPLQGTWWCPASDEVQEWLPGSPGVVANLSQLDEVKCRSGCPGGVANLCEVQEWLPGSPGVVANLSQLDEVKCRSGCPGEVANLSQLDEVQEWLPSSLGGVANLSQLDDVKCRSGCPSGVANLSQLDEV